MERDRTAQTEPLTIGQQLVARWESPASGWSEPADLAEAIDTATTEAFERGKREAYIELNAFWAYMAECRNTKQTEAGQ